MTPDPLNWLPDDGPVSLDEFRARLSGVTGQAVDKTTAQGHLTTMRANGLVSVTGDPRQPETMRVTKRPPRSGSIPASRPEFHSLGGHAPDLRMDQVESRLAALERRVSVLEAERA